MPLKIVFMGTPEFSVPTLDLLIKNKFDVVSVYTQPPKKSKRGQKINVSPIEEFSKKNKLNFRNPKNLNSDEEFKVFTELSMDLVVVVSYGQIIQHMKRVVCRCPASLLRLIDQISAM